jgi:hypothetical protein
LTFAGAKPLLSLLSVLPDGISDADLLQSNPDIPDILTAKAALLQTSLAYLNHDGQLKVLAPVREYIHSIYPPPFSVILPVRKYLHELLKLYKKYRGLLSSETVLDRITLNLGNLQNILVLALNPNDPDLEQAVDCALLFGRICYYTGRGQNIVMDYIPPMLSRIPNLKLHVKFLGFTFTLWTERPIADPQALIDSAQNLFLKIHDNETQGQYSLPPLQRV